MVTAEEAFNAVQNKQRIPLLKEESILTTIYNIIIKYINNGWLGCNLVNYLKTKEKLTIVTKLQDLGYLIDSDGICYWHYNPINKAK